MNGHSGTAHQMGRLPAELEWDICRGFKEKFEGLNPGDRMGVDLSDLEKAELEPALARLKQAEGEMSREAALYFRARLVKMIAGYIAR